MLIVEEDFLPGGSESCYFMLFHVGVQNFQGKKDSQQMMWLGNSAPAAALAS